MINLHTSKNSNHNEKFGDKLIDTITEKIGSWKFIALQSIIVLVWITLFIIGYILKWNIHSFISLNLIFATQSAYIGPMIMMSQNRQSKRDRDQALKDYQTNIEAKKEIEALHNKLSKIEIHKLDRIIELLEKNK